MSAGVFRPLAVAYVALAVVVWGCGTPSEHQPSAASPAAGDRDQGDPDHVDQANLNEQAQRIEDALASLSLKDRASADQQGTCPVTGLKLGAMGTPIKITVQDRQLWICCPDCEATIRKDPEKYLSKLPSPN